MGKKERNGFRVPDGYFSKFPDRLQDALRQETGMTDSRQEVPGQKAHEEHPGRLAGSPVHPSSKGGFRTPEGYFESFGDRLNQRLEETLDETKAETPDKTPHENLDKTKAYQAPKTRVISLRKRTLGWVAAVAAAVVLTLVLWPASRSSNLDFGDLADAEIEQYLEIGYEDISAYELAESLPVEELEMGIIIDTETQEQQLLEYLDRDPEVLEEVYWEEDNP